MRTLPAQLKAYFDSKTQGQSDSLDPAHLLMITALSCVGVKEEGGDNQGPLIELFQSTVAHPEGQPWCLDFLQACIAYVEEVKGIQSPLPPTQSVLDLWNHAKVYQAVQPAQLGCLILWQHGDTLSGHSGIITAMNSLTYETVEGNTSDSQGIDREGDGVYLKKRARGGTQSFRELGFLKVFS